MIAVDVGNTKTAIGYFNDGVLVRKWRIATEARQTSDQYQALLDELLYTVNSSLKNQGNLILSSVVPKITTEWERLTNVVDVHVVTHKTPASFEISIPDPPSLGADRIADAEAAVRKYGTPVITIDAGTAITLGVVNADRRLIGGSISPGVGISLKALFMSAARIGQVEMELPAKAIGRTTQEAIESGIHFGYSAMINGLIEKFEQELQGPKPTIVATGGSIPYLTRYLRKDIHLEENLTIEGLQFLYQNLKEGKRKHA